MTENTSVVGPPPGPEYGTPPWPPLPEAKRPWYRRPSGILLLIVVIAVVAAAVLVVRTVGSGDGAARTVQTSSGPVTVKSVQIGESIPPGCDPSDAACLKAESGYTVVKVTFADADFLSFSWLKQADVYVQSSTGTQTDAAVVGSTGAGDTITWYAAFAVDEQDTGGLSLHLPGAEPFPVDEQSVFGGE